MQKNPTTPLYTGQKSALTLLELARNARHGERFSDFTGVIRFGKEPDADTLCVGSDNDVNWCSEVDLNFTLNATPEAIIELAKPTRESAAAYLRQADDIEFLETLAAAGEQTAPPVLDLMEARRLLFGLLSRSKGAIMCDEPGIAAALTRWFEKETARRAPPPPIEDFCG